MNIITTSVIKSTLRFTPRVHPKLDSLVINRQKDSTLSNSLCLDEKPSAKILDESIKKTCEKNLQKSEKQENLSEISKKDSDESLKVLEYDFLEPKMKQEATIKTENIIAEKIHETIEKTKDVSIVSSNNKYKQKNNEMSHSELLEDKKNKKSIHFTPSLNTENSLLKKRELKVIESDQNTEQNFKELKKPKRKRPISPVNSEQLTIEPTEVKISDLCKDIRIGRKSAKFHEIRKLEAIKRKIRSKNNNSCYKEKQVGENLNNNDKNVSNSDENVQKICLNTCNTKSSTLKNEDTHATKYHLKGAPQVRVVNGKIVIDEASLQVDRHERDVNPNIKMEFVEENDLSRKVNSASWGKREKSDRWSKEDTLKFYNALSQWGTDFGVICKMFPNRSQRQIKNKFNSEERKYPEKINIAIKSRKPIDIVAYSKATGSNFRSIDEIEAELKKVKEDFEESRRISIENAQLLAKNKN